MAELLAFVLAIALTLYALLGGADFGGGVWDLLARGPRKGAQRDRIARALGPVWEVNHVWLILAVVLLFAGFPRAFAALSIAYDVPITALLVGIVLRGAAFTFRAYDTRGDRVQRRWGFVFSVASVIAPVLLGCIVGAIAEGSGWLTPYSVMTGLFTLSLFSYLAASYVTAECEPGALQDDFRRRAIGAWLVTGALSIVVALLSRTYAPRVFHGLSLALLSAQAAASVGALVALWKRHAETARVLAASQGALVVLGWAAAQYPHLTPTLSVQSAAASPAVLRALLQALCVGVVVLAPSLWLLLRTFKLRAPAR